MIILAPQGIPYKVFSKKLEDVIATASEVLEDYVVSVHSGSYLVPKTFAVLKDGCPLHGIKK